MELRDLRWALVVSRHRSLRQAAATLNVRQSTLSRRLRDLEYRLEGIVKLFDVSISWFENWRRNGLVEARGHAATA